MTQGSYEFDPCSVDGSDEVEDSEEEVTLDSWKPSPKKDILREPSKWRQEQNSKGYGFMNPGLDEIKKIRHYLRNKRSDLEIMDTFAINADTLFAIKNNRFDAVDGIIDNQTDILFKTTALHERRIDDIKLKIKNQVANLTTDAKFVAWINEMVAAKVAEALKGKKKNG